MVLSFYLTSFVPIAQQAVPRRLSSDNVTEKVSSSVSGGGRVATRYRNVPAGYKCLYAQRPLQENNWENEWILSANNLKNEAIVRIVFYEFCFLWCQVLVKQLTPPGARGVIIRKNCSDCLLCGLFSLAPGVGEAADAAWRPRRHHTQKLFGLSSMMFIFSGARVGEAANATWRPRRHHTQKLFGLSSISFNFFGARCWWSRWRRLAPAASSSNPSTATRLRTWRSWAATAISWHARRRHCCLAI